MVLGACWAVLGRRKAEKEENPKTFKNPMKINDFLIDTTPSPPLPLPRQSHPGTHPPAELKLRN